MVEIVGIIVEDEKIEEKEVEKKEMREEMEEKVEGGKGKKEKGEVGNGLIIILDELVEEMKKDESEKERKDLGFKKGVEKGIKVRRMEKKEYY